MSSLYKWHIPNKLISKMTKYQELAELWKEKHRPKVEQEMWELKTEILTLLFGEPY